MDATATTPTIGKVEVKSPATDPTIAALLAGRNNYGSGFGTGNDGGLLMLLLLSMFRGVGGFGGIDAGRDPLVTASIMTSKDVSAQLNTFQAWASNNATQIQQAICGIDKSICQSSAQITAAVNALTPQMFQSFAAQSQQMGTGFSNLAMQLCQCCNQMERTVTSGFAQVNENLCDAAKDLESQGDRNFNALTLQASTNAAAAALALCQTQNLIQAGNAALSNQLNMQTCELKTAILADGATTRDLIRQNETARLLQELTDTKNALNNCQQTGNFSTILNAQLQPVVAAVTRCCPPCPGA